MPVLIEVKTTAPTDLSRLFFDTLSLKPAYLAYAELLGLPMLVAWRCGGIWALFEMRHARLATVNYKIDFESALKENLLGVLAGDFLYHLAPGTLIQMRIRKLTELDPETGGFEFEIIDVHFANPAGDRIPDVPYLWSHFMFWEHDSQVVDEGAYIVQSFVVPEPKQAIFASQTLSRLVQAFSGLRRSQVSWHSIVHDPTHMAHERARIRVFAEEGARHGATTGILNVWPHSSPSFL